MHSRHINIPSDQHFIYISNIVAVYSVNCHLSETTRCNHIVHPLHSEASAQLDRLNVTFSRTSEGREEEAHAEGIVDITEGIDEGGVPAITNENQLVNTTQYSVNYTFFFKDN